jgi:hypothetical protein
MAKGSSINDVTVLEGEEFKGFVSTVKVSVIKSVTMGEVGQKKCQKLCDVIYGLSLT